MEIQRPEAGIPMRGPAYLPWRELPSQGSPLAPRAGRKPFLTVHPDRVGSGRRPASDPRLEVCPSPGRTPPLGSHRMRLTTYPTSSVSSGLAPVCPWSPEGTVLQSRTSPPRPWPLSPSVMNRRRCWHPLRPRTIGSWPLSLLLLSWVACRWAELQVANIC